MKRVLAIACLVLPLSAAATEPSALEFGRYLAKYPAMYGTLWLSDDARDKIYDQHGDRREGVAPTYGPGGKFPEQRAITQLEWFFPFFETEQVPFISSRLWTANATFGYARERTQGPLDAYAAANGLSGAQSGNTDLTLQFGPVLYGSADWRTRTETPLSVVLLADINLPVGRRDPDSPNNVGTNVFAFGGTLGAHWRPLNGLFVDAGAHWRGHTRNQEPAFGGQEPTHLGDEWIFDGTLAAKIWGGIYAAASYYERRGADDEYSRVRFSAHPPAAPLLMDTFPDAGTFHDEGTRERRLDGALYWFALQRLRLSLHYVLPLAGKSGEFNLPYEKQLIDCGSLGGCNPQSNGSDHVDGLGGARAYATRYFALSATWSFGQGDFWLRGP